MLFVCSDIRLRYLGDFGTTQKTFTVPSGTTTDDIFLRMKSLWGSQTAWSAPNFIFSISGTTLTVRAQATAGSAEKTSQANASGEVYLVV